MEYVKKKKRNTQERGEYFDICVMCIQRSYRIYEINIHDVQDIVHSYDVYYFLLKIIYII